MEKGANPQVCSDALLLLYVHVYEKSLNRKKEKEGQIKWERNNIKDEMEKRAGHNTKTRLIHK